MVTRSDLTTTREAETDMLRQITDDQGRNWDAVWVESTGAHLVRGATLAFRPTGEPTAEPIPTPVEFNSPAAAELAISTMGDKELRRRLQWAKTAAGIG